MHPLPFFFSFSHCETEYFSFSECLLKCKYNGLRLHKDESYVLSTSMVKNRAKKRGSGRKKKNKAHLGEESH